MVAKQNELVVYYEKKLNKEEKERKAIAKRLVNQRNQRSVSQKKSLV